MSYFAEIEDYKTYAGQEADFHFTYNSNSGGGQAFLGGRFFDENKKLVSPETINGKPAVFAFSSVNISGDEILIELNDSKSRYDIKPRGNGSASMKLGVGTDREAPSRILAAALMLPQTCGVKMPSNLDISILTAGNFWLQSMWLECFRKDSDPNLVLLCPKDYVFCGGINKDSTDASARCFKLDAKRRIYDIINLIHYPEIFPEEITKSLKVFADVYLGESSFRYIDCEKARNSLQINLASEYPTKYSGVSDPLPVLCQLAEAYANEKKGGDLFKTGYINKKARNRIIFGAPGTGKSFTINNDRKELLGDNNEGDYERVTFHPDYSYANFVGTYKPVMVANRKMSADRDTDYVISVLNDKRKSAQEKYDILFERFKDKGLTRLPVLLGLYTDELFKTRKQDGSDAAGDNSVERNHGRAIRKYVSLLTGQETTSDIAYEYVPGPFMRVYVNALKNARSGKPKPYLLIIEEINRANVAAVFGDVFQLLDRGDDQASEYPIQASEDIKNYLAKELGGEPDDYSKIRIPDNMFIWATMNSADQGVFPMDTAFKRRWDFTYLGIDDSDKDIRGKYVTIGSKEKQRIEWNELRKSINEFLANEKINEDKQLGPYFISRNIVVPASGTEIDSKRFCDVFKHKVLMYLFDDAAKQKRAKLFEGSAKGQARYSKICEAFEEQGIGIFHADIQNRVKIKDLVINEHEVDENGMVKTEAGTESED